MVSLAHGFIFDLATGSMTEMGPPGVQTSFYGLNDAGNAVGWIESYQNPNYVQGAVLWKDGALVDLNTVLDPVTGAGLWMGEARSINNNGQILVRGLNAANRVTWFLLTPIEP